MFLCTMEQNANNVKRNTYNQNIQNKAISIVLTEFPAQVQSTASTECVLNASGEENLWKSTDIRLITAEVSFINLLCVWF